MEPASALISVENSLRDLIEYTLSKIYGDQWLNCCGVTLDRIEKWREKHASDSRKMEYSGIVESRIIYYSDFYDLLPILKKHWESIFKSVFGNLKRMEVYMDLLETFRNCSAHGRDYLPHHNYLVLGIVGDIRTAIIKYRSKMETSEDFYPRFESIRDNLDNVGNYLNYIVSTGNILRIGDTISFVLTASDPFGEPVEFLMYVPGAQYISPWTTNNKLEFTFTNKTVGKVVTIAFQLRSQREFHAKGEFDDYIEFQYEVLPVGK